ncbi:MAG: MFS transporter [Saccharofermentanales bacterium]
MNPKIKSYYDEIKTKSSLRKAEFEVLPEEEKKIVHGRRNFVVDNISIYIIVSISAGSYLAGLLKHVGVPAEINGLILAIPVLAGFFQIIGAIVSQKLNSQKALVVTGIAIQRTCLSVIFIYPLLFGPGIASSVLIIVTYAVGFFAGTLAGPSAATWLVSLVPAHLRGKYFSMRERLSMLFVAASMVTVSLVLDKSKQLGNIVYGFAAIGFFLLIVSAIDVYHVARIYEPPSVLAKGRFSVKSLIEPIKDKVFIKVIIVLILWQISAQIAIPFMGLYYIENIGISYTMIGVVALVVTLEKALIVNLWGKFADRTSWDHVLKIAVLIFAVSQAMQIFLTAGNYIWLYPSALIVGNVSWSVLNIAFFNFQFHFINPAKSTFYVGVCGAISSTAGFLTAMLGSALLNFIHRNSFAFSGHRLLILLSALLGGLLSLYMHLTFSKIRREVRRDDR